MKTDYPHGRRGFAGMASDKQRAIASKGGRMAHVKGTGHEWTSKEASAAGRLGGQASRGGRGKLPPEEQPPLLAEPSLLRSRDYQPRQRRKPALTRGEGW